MQTDDRIRARMNIRGAVQGVGFRPFMYNLAVSLDLTGWVANTSSGVLAEFEGPRSSLEALLLRLDREKPPRASIQGLECSFLDPVSYTGVEIRDSIKGDPHAVLIPDIAICDACRRELADPRNRRYQYPFITCSHCGPRYSIIDALPYDRMRTSMRQFTMCAACQHEYDDPADRRFHAETNACPQCGPHLALWDASGRVTAEKNDALRKAVNAIRAGHIVAVKGLGGFHLIVDACNQDAVARLRHRKHREEKPLALMYPSLESICRDCDVSPLEARTLSSPESPIVLLRKRNVCRIAAYVAPDNPSWGVMLPYTPLHVLMMELLGSPVVATSANVSDEPICHDEHKALVRLTNIADCFLVHNRPIIRHVDDSIVRFMAGRECLLRRARGYVPLPVVTTAGSPPLLAVGAHLKNTVALAKGTDIFLSQHIGDLETEQSFDCFKKTIADFEQLFDATPSLIAHDLHPRYRSTQYAEQCNVPQVAVQHHHAHILSCMADNELEAPVLGVSWDGTGYGPDGLLWGGEFLIIGTEGFRRYAHFEPFPLPGGDRAIKEPRRTAIGLLYQQYGEACFTKRDLPPFRDFTDRDCENIHTMLARRLSSPLTTSVGRLFDAVAALLGIRQKVSFEGQAAMELEYACTDGCEDVYTFRIREEAGMQIVSGPFLQEIIADRTNGIPLGISAAKFHNMLVEIIVALARQSGEHAVVLSGGCFQNAYLTEHVIRRLREEQIKPYWHQRVPPNDGGIALGQIIAAQQCSR